MNEKRHNVCLLAATLTDLFSNELVKGAINAAKRLDIDLTVIPGKYLGIQHLNDKYEAYYEYQYNVLFDYAAKANFDYIIAPVGTIAYAYNNELKKVFLENFKGTPVLCVASEIEGFDCLEFDNRSGVISAVNYLAERGRRHIGILAGSAENGECIERCEAYRTALAQNGLEFKESYLMHSAMSYDSKEDAERLLDNNPELDAVICINDLIASMVYDAVSERGKIVGKDIAVIGFDDQPFAKDMEPPLASVKADASRLGEAAVEKAYNYLNGIKDDRRLVDTSFIPRGSCFADKRFISTPETLFMGDTAAIKRNLMEYITDGTGSEKEAKVIFEPLSGLLDFFEKEFFRHAAPESSKKTADEYLMRVFGNKDVFNGETTRLYTLRDNLYVWLLRNCSGENLPFIQKLLNSVEKYIGEKTDTAPKSFIDRTHLDNLFIRDSLMFGGNLKDSYADIQKRLCNLGSVTSYLYILEKPVEHHNGEKNLDDVKWLFKSYCYGANCFNIPEKEQRIDTPQVFDNPKLVSDRTRILIAADLFTAETQYGLALLEPESLDFIDELELVTYQLSSAVRSLDILKNLNNLLTDTRLALAMANDYKYIYCVDVNNGSYYRYERERTDKDFTVKVKGSDFYADCEILCRERICEEDRILFRDMLTKETFLERIDSGELFSFDYRYMKNGVPVYYRLKTIVGTDENKGTVFIGVTDIDIQKRYELKANEERMKFARISNALASRYELIYYINTVTGEYTAYTSSDKYNELSSGEHGEDFFSDVKQKAEAEVFPEDLEMVRKHLQKEHLLMLLREDETVSLSYRLIIDGNMQYMNMNAVRMTDNDEYVIIAVNNVTAAKLREMEIKAELFRDALTGVKNKSAYRNTESKTDALIKENICEDFSIFVFDLNDLKKINDNLGHDEGDKYIRAGSSFICNTFKHSPVFRIGGDEFAAILTGSDFDIREELKNSIKEQVESNKRNGGVVIAVGSADYASGHDTCLLDVFKRADKEMYEDKHRLKSMP